MSKRRYMVKEVTCRVCQGNGILYNMEECREEECYNCEGKGYVVDAVDRLTGYRIFSLEEEQQ